MKLRAALSALPALGGCGPDLDRLERICHREGRVQVHDPAAWAAYLRELKGHTVASYGGNAPGRYLRLSSMQGFRFENEGGRGKELNLGAPVRNDYFILRNDRPVATVTNYILRWQGFGAGQSVECINEHPDVYGLTLRQIVRVQ